jgi:hypothetical protein
VTGDKEYTEQMKKLVRDAHEAMYASIRYIICESVARVDRILMKSPENATTSWNFISTRVR